MGGPTAVKAKEGTSIMTATEQALTRLSALEGDIGELTNDRTILSTRQAKLEAELAELRDPDTPARAGWIERSREIPNELENLQQKGEELRDKCRVLNDERRPLTKYRTQAEANAKAERLQEMNQAQAAHAAIWTSHIDELNNALAEVVRLRIEGADAVHEYSKLPEPMAQIYLK